MARPYYTKPNRRTEVPLKKFLDRAVGVACLIAIGVAMGFTVDPSDQSKKSGRPASQIETIYVVNHAQQYISDKTILHDIPAWEQATNKDFSPAWHTARVRIVLVRSGKSAPAAGITATFVKNGPVQGALAYHTVVRGVPQIVVYAGTGAYYGYNNSVSFTHELFELLADPSISITNQGYPYPDVCAVGSIQCLPQVPGTVWANEVCDPVEDYAYSVHGVQISDFITPNWFNDEVKGPVDFMNYLGSPFLIAPGGYAQFWNGFRWQAVVNFRHAHEDGFLKGEKLGEKLGESSRS